MRITPRCPGFLPGELCRTISRNGHAKIFLSVLLIFASVLVITITIVETRSSWQRRDISMEPHIHPASRRKFSVAVATDISNNDLRYGVVIDCGSSGSRVFVYFWPPHNGNPKELLNIHHMRDKDGAQVLKKITPGLSAYEDSPSEASDYLRPLLKYAAEHVPFDKHAETPLYIMATAGLRMLPTSAQNAIMDDLRVDIPLDFRFMFVGTQAEVITGKQEGVFAWIAINYVLGKFDHLIGRDRDEVSVVDVPGHDSSTHIRKRTIGIIDMGGGSTQIAYEVPQSVRFVSGKEDVAKSFIAEFNLGCTSTDLDHTYRVYVSTFLGFGANAVRARYENYIISSSIAGTPEKTNRSDSLPGRSVATAILDPCLPTGMPDLVDYDGKKYHLQGTGNYDECVLKSRPLLNATVECVKEPCSMNGIFQPRIDYRNSEFYGFSELFYTMEDILNIGGKYKFLKFNQAAKGYCNQPWSTIKEWYKNGRYPRSDFNRYKYQCFKSSWITNVLHEGFRFPKVYSHFTSAQLIEGKEVHWTLGALLYKTRYFPLSAIQQHVSHHPRPPWVVEQVQHSTYVIIVCFFVVVAAIFIYLRRLRIVRRPDLRKVPSMAYFMTEEGQVEEGITVRQVYG